jgi:CubicO group peptidase (beta-lactamase class C family)
MMRRSVGLGLSLALCLTSGPAAVAEAPPVERPAAERLRAAAEAAGTGAAVLVGCDGKVVLEDGFGFADRKAGRKVTRETLFRIGSVTKQFTAAAILRLAEQGKLDLSDRLAEYFPGFARGAEITLRQMLTHTSGLHSYTDKPEFLGRVTRPIEPTELIAWFRDDPPDFAPGAGFRYSNSAYFLLGEIVARVSGRPLGEHLRAEFFEPLGMQDTGIYVNSAPPPNMAVGYAVEGGAAEPALDWDMSWAGGAGALYSSVGDLFRWTEALFGGRVLGAASLEAATTPVELPDGADGMEYGYGLVAYEVERLPAIGHGGGLNGWGSDLLYLPQQRCTVAVLVNALPPAPGLGASEISRALVRDLLAAEIARAPVPAEDPAADPRTFAAYAGRYDYKNAVMTVTVEGEGLFAQLTGQPKHRIFPRSADEFFWKVVDAQVAFVRDKEGRVVAARHSQGGNVFTAPRLADAAPALSPEELDAFTGEYQYGPAAVLVVTRDGGQLLAQLTGQPRFPIFPRAADEFEWRVVPAQVRFVRGADGKVVKAVHTQAGNTFDAPKIR